MNIIRLTCVGLICSSAIACLRQMPSNEGSPGSPNVLAIDDFEDKNHTPAASSFADWQCYLYNTAESRAGAPPRKGSLRCSVGKHGFNSNYAQAIVFDLLDAADGKPDHVGAGLRTITKAGTLDISGYRRLTFSAWLESLPERPLPKGTQLTVGIGCPSVSDGIVPGGYSILRHVNAGSGWATFGLDLADFAQPDWQSPPFDPKQCLTLVTGIFFHVQPPLDDGAGAAGRLGIDTVYFQ